MNEANVTKFRRLLILATALCILGLSAGSDGLAGTRIDYSELYVIYTGNTAIQVKFNGNILRSGAVIPAGPYNVIVYDEGDNPNPRFVMAGAGVSISSDLNPSGMGLQSVTFGPYTLPTNASYRIEDTNLGPSSAVTLTTSTTSTTSTSSSGPSGTGATNSSGSTGSSQPTGATSNPTSAKVQGTLKASVNAAGKTTLTLSGKPATTLKAGRYTVTATDQSKIAGLIIGTTAKRTTTISGLAATGTKSRTISLTTGTWYIQPTPSGKKTYFTVAK